MYAQAGEGGIALLCNLGARCGWVVNSTPRFTVRKETQYLLNVQEAGWASEPVWTGAKNVVPPTGIGSPDRPARSEKVYVLCSSH